MSDTHTPAQPVIAPTNAEGVLMPKVPTDEILEAIVKEFEFQEADWMWHPKTMYQRILDAARKGIAPEWVRLTSADIREMWQSENGLEDCDLCKIDDFKKAARFFEAAFIAKQSGIL